MGIKLNKKPIITVVAVIWCLLQLYIGFFGVLAPMEQRPLHVAFALILTYLTKPITKKLDSDKLYLDQIIALILTVVFAVYMYTHAMALSMNIGIYNSFEIFLGAVILILVIEAARRLTGIGLITIGLVFLIYAYVGPYMPGPIRHPGASLSKIFTFSSLTTESIFGTCIDACSTFIFLFVLYAKVLEKTGGGQVFIDVACSLVGRVRGGPAKVSVVASGLFGSISGSAVANVVGTGTFTIPLMKKIGYKSEFAGAVEAVASSGGQFMPPIMGASAFLIAEIVGIPYWTVAACALVPAVLYYLAVFFMVDFEAGKTGLTGMKPEELPRTRDVLKKGWPSLVSPVVLIVLLAGLQWSPAKAAVWSIGVAFIICMINPNTRLTGKQIIETMVEGAMALKLSSLLITASGGHLIVLMLLTMIACIIMGMGLPTVACYVVLASMIAPALIKMGVLPIAAHLFIFYFGIISAITPPVALASMVAAGIAKAPFIKTSLQALKLGAAAFVLPFMFVLNPALILQGGVLEVIQCVFTATVGIFSMSVMLEGYFLERVEGDINLLTGFFSTMLIDMAGILFLFLRSQTVIAGMWREARGAQTRVLGEFSQDVAACMDIRGGRKEEYARERLEKEFRALAQSYEKASFWGNLPSTVFYSLLNVAEGAVLLLGVSFLQKGEITLGTV